MATLKDLMYPPGLKPSKNTTNTGKATYEVVAPVTSGLLVTNQDDHKYSLTEAKLRILSCCRELGISETNEVKYPDLQRAYKLKFDIELGRDELFHLFSNRNATNSLKEGLRSFMHVIEASKTDDNTIRLKLKENSSTYIQELESRYDGPPFRQLTADQIDSIFNPQKRDIFYQNGNGSSQQQRYNGSNNYQTRGLGRARFITRNARNDGPAFNYQPHPPPQSFFGPNNQSYPPPPSNNWNDNNYRRQYPQQNYYQNSNYYQQRPYIPHHANNGYDNEPAFEPMAAYVNDQKKQKEADRQRIQYQHNVLKEDYAKLRQDHEDERERILQEIRDEAEAKLDHLFTKYYDKLGEVEKHAVEENKSIVKEYLKLKE